MNVVGVLGRTSKRLLKRALRPVLSGPPASVRPSPPEHWGLARSPSDALTLDGIVLSDLAGRWGSPLHIVNATRLRENARRFLAVPAGAQSGCEAFYSYKTNPVPGVLSELHALGMGAEVISHYELWLARRLGVPAERIVFNGPAKSEASIREAITAGIQLLNLNHREEIPLVARIAAQLDRKVRVGIRITVGQGWAAQFGVPVEGGRAFAAYEEALRSPHLDVVAVHAHRGGMIRTAEELAWFVRAVLAFANELYERLGLSLDVLNFGGSLSTPTVNSLSSRDVRLNRAFHRDLVPPDPAAALSIDRYVATLLDLVETFYRDRRRPRPRVFVEPGRAVTGDSQMLLANVVATKADGGATFAILNAGINLAESCRSEYHHLLSANGASAPATDVYTVVGPICTPGDTLYWAARMPRLEPGDAVLIMDAGAYFVPFSTSFSFPRAPIVLVDRGEVTLLRRAETFEDLVEFDRLAGTTARAPEG
jgi:diaminopimelate decarboxylase